MNPGQEADGLSNCYLGSNSVPYLLLSERILSLSFSRTETPSSSLIECKSNALQHVFPFILSTTFMLGSATFFWKGPEGKYFGLCEPFGCNYWTLPLRHESSQRHYIMNEVKQCLKLYLWTLKSEFGYMCMGKELTVLVSPVCIEIIHNVWDQFYKIEKVLLANSIITRYTVTSQDKKQLQRWEGSFGPRPFRVGRVKVYITLETLFKEN